MLLWKSTVKTIWLCSRCVTYRARFLSCKHQEVLLKVTSPHAIASSGGQIFISVPHILGIDSSQHL